MSFISLFTLAIGVAMDAFAVSICKGLAIERVTIKKAIIVGIWFGGFQGLMPLIGYILGVQFKDKITAIDHWIAFILLLIIGGRMMKESFSKKEKKDTDEALDFKTMLLLAIATSIDALAIGITLAFLQVNIISAILLIGLLTFILSFIGVKIGNIFGGGSKIEFIGGLILVLMGINILLQHTGII